MKRLIFCFVFFLSPLLGHSEFQNFPHSKAKTLWAAAETKNSFWVGLHVEFEKDWHSYWSNPGDSGAAPIFDIQHSKRNIESSPIQWPVPKRFQSNGLSTFIYEEEMILLRKIQFPSESFDPTEKLLIEAEWLVCKVECVPAFASFSINLSRESQEDAKIIEKALNRVPQQKRKWIFQQQGSSLSMEADTEIVDFFPEASQGIDNEFQKINLKKLVLKSESSGLHKKIRGLAIAKKGEAFWVEALPGEKSMWTFIIFAFLGGLILNLMPCVFPILSLKLLSLFNKIQESPKKVRFDALIYSIGVILSFQFISLLLIILRKQGQALGWGFQLQSPPFLVIMILIFTALSLNFLGLYEFQIPGLNTGEKLSQKKNWMGSFFSGVLSVLVASPCTAPFMGVAMGFALSQEALATFLIFLSLALGFATPFLLFVFFPRLIRYFPKSGAWMLHLKKVLFVPMLLSIVWLAWVLGNIQGKSSFYLVLGAALLLALSFFIHFKKKNFAISSAVLMSSLSLALASLFIQSPVGTQQSSLDWMSFHDAEIAKLIGGPRGVFVNFTADWCLSCKVNEQVVFKNKEVLGKINQNEIILVKADWTKKDALIARELEKHGRYSVPLYLYYAPGKKNVKILPTLLTPGLFLKELEL